MTKTKHWQIRRCGAFWCALCPKLEGNTKLSKLFLLPANSSPKRHEMYSVGVGEIVHSFFGLYIEKKARLRKRWCKKCWTFPSKFVDHVLVYIYNLVIIKGIVIGLSNWSVLCHRVSLIFRLLRLYRSPVDQPEIVYSPLYLLLNYIVWSSIISIDIRQTNQQINRYSNLSKFGNSCKIDISKFTKEDLAD